MHGAQPPTSTFHGKVKCNTFVEKWEKKIRSAKETITSLTSYSLDSPQKALAADLPLSEAEGVTLGPPQGTYTAGGEPHQKRALLEVMAPNPLCSPRGEEGIGSVQRVVSGCPGHTGGRGDFL